MEFSKATIFDKIAIFQNNDVNFFNIENIKRDSYKSFKSFTITITYKDKPLDLSCKGGEKKLLKTIDNKICVIKLCKPNDMMSEKERVEIDMKLNRISRKVERYIKRYGLKVV